MSLNTSSSSSKDYDMYTTVTTRAYITILKKIKLSHQTKVAPHIMTFCPAQKTVSVL